MVCADCGGEVVWIGPITNLSHTECKQCGAINNYLNEQGEDDLQSNEIAMMKIKTSKLTGRVLNYAVALAVGGYELIPVPHNNQRGDDYDYQKTKKETCTTANAYQRQDGTFLSGIYQIPR